MRATCRVRSTHGLRPFTSHRPPLGGLELLPQVRRGLTGEAEDFSVPSLFRALRGESVQAFYHGMSCWWVPSHDGGETPARAMLQPGLPPPSDYATMLAGERRHGLARAVGEG